MDDGFQQDDFTEESYRRVVRAGRSAYEFEPFGTESVARHVLWRHDVDFSVHRAARLAEIEAEVGARATYLLSLRSPFYSLLERPVRDRVLHIAKLGHWIGLHFELDPAARVAEEEIEPEIASERDLLADLIELPVRTLSFHNPQATGTDHLDQDRIAGMDNVYARSVRERYAYVSDSNGYWRHHRLSDVIEAAEPDLLQVLTHPEWWQKEAMSPRDRMERCIQGRADAAREWYEGPVRTWGRKLPG